MPPTFREALEQNLSADQVVGEGLADFFIKKGPADAGGPETFLGKMKRGTVGALGALVGRRARWQADSYIKGRILPMLKELMKTAEGLERQADEYAKIAKEHRWSSAQAFRRGQEMPSSTDEAPGSVVANGFEKLLFTKSAQQLDVYLDYFFEKYVSALPMDGDTAKSKRLRALVASTQRAHQFVRGIFVKMEQVRATYKGRSVGTVSIDQIASLGNKLADNINIIKTNLGDIEAYI